jgi:hypothetical protein
MVKNLYKQKSRTFHLPLAGRAVIVSSVLVSTLPFFSEEGEGGHGGGRMGQETQLKNAKPGCRISSRQEERIVPRQD